MEDHIVEGGVPVDLVRAVEGGQSGIDHAHMRGLGTTWRRSDRRLTSLYTREFPDGVR